MVGVVGLDEYAWWRVISPTEYLVRFADDASEASQERHAGACFIGIQMSPLVAEQKS